MIRNGPIVVALAAGAYPPRSTPRRRRSRPAMSKSKVSLFVHSAVDAHVDNVVEWSNHDFAPHTATGDHSEWDTGLLKNGSQKQIVLTAAGTITYHCMFYPQMKEVVHVTAQNP